jgi:hypothetical protein
MGLLESSPHQLRLILPKSAELLAIYLLSLYNTLLITTKEKTMESNHDILKAQFEAYLAENEKFTTKGVKAAAARARKALQEISKAVKERRKEITAEKEAMTTAK